MEWALYDSHASAGVIALVVDWQRSRSAILTLIVQDDGEQRVVDLEPLLVVDEPQSLKFHHEEIDPRARRADHFRQRLLRDLRDGPHGRVLLSVPRDQQ